MQTTRIKLMSATIGAGAVIAMGGLTVALSSTSAAQPTPAPPGPVPTSDASTAKTSTEATAPPAPPVPNATPSVTATSQPKGFAEVQ